MEQPRPYLSMIVALLLMLALCLVGVGCFGGGDDETSGATRTTRAGAPAGTEVSPSDSLITAQAEELSTFRPKDPFIPQAVAVTTTTAVGPTSTTQPGGGGGSTSTTSSTAYRPTTSTTRPGGGGGGATTTTRPGSTTTTAPQPTTTTTAPHPHTLKVLAIGEVGVAPAVTFKVDSGVYKDRRVGDVVSSRWGQIKVMDISTSSKVVTLLQGSETLVLAVGQVIFE